MYWLTKTALRAPVASSLLLLLATAFFVAGLPRARTEFGYRPLLGGAHPAIQDLEDFITTYGGGFPLLVVYDCGPDRPCASALDAAALRMTAALGDELAVVSGVRNVFSPSNSSLVIPGPDGFAVRRLVEADAIAVDAPALAARALSDPLWIRSLVSEDAAVGAIILQLEDSRSDTMVRVVESIREAIGAYERQGFEFYLVGHPIESVVAGQELAASTAAATPYTAIIIAVIIFALTRSWQAVVITMATMGLGLVWTYGLLGWLGWPQDSVLQILSTLIVVVGVCDAVHLLSRHSVEIKALRQAATRDTRRAAIIAAARTVGPPCLITTLTTAGAFLSFITSDLATFVRFGLISAAGVAICLALTFSFLPLLVTFLPDRSARPHVQSRPWTDLLSAVAHTAQRRASVILLLAAIAAVVGSVGWLAYLRVDTDINEMYGERSQVTRWIRFVDEHLRGLDSLEIDIALPPRAAVEDDETQQILSDFAAFLEATEGLGKTTSLQDLMRRLNLALHNDAPGFDRLGESATANAELIELIGFDDPTTLNSWLSLDRRRVRISVEGPSDSATGRGEVLGIVRDYIDSRLPEDWEVTLTGPFAMEYNWVTEIQNTQITSFTTAFLIVFTLLMVFLRSIRLSLAAMLPAVLPVIVTLGTMGLAGLQLDVGRVMIAAIVLGIAVDDSVHLLGHYRSRRSAGDEPAQAISAALVHIGPAVVVTSLALALGFLTLIASAWQTISSFGFFVSLAILCALVASLFVLPALIFSLPRQRQSDISVSIPRRTDDAAAERGLLLFVAVLPLVISLIAGFSLALRDDSSRELPCWILPNGRVMHVPVLTRDCPLQGNDQISSVAAAGRPAHRYDNHRGFAAVLQTADSALELSVLRAGSPRRVELPIRSLPRGVRLARIAAVGLVACLLLCVPLVLLQRSKSEAVLPLALYFSATSVLLVTFACGRNSPWLQRSGVIAALAAPAILAHLGLTFPRERRTIKERRVLLLIPYAVSAILLPAALVALESNAVIWPFVYYMLAVLTVGGWLVLVLSCAFAIRESGSPVESARARVLCYGTLLLPLLPVFLFGRSSLPDAAAMYLGSAPVLLPLPIAFAVSRYNLFNLETDVQHTIARILYYAVASATVALIFAAAGIPLPNGSGLALVALSLACIVTVEQARRPLLGFIEAVFSPSETRLQAHRDEFVRDAAELRNQNEVARLLGDTVEHVLWARSGCVFLASGGEWLPAHSFGHDAPSGVELVHAALPLLTETCILQIDPEPSSDDVRLDLLRERGVELAALLERGNKHVGLMLLTHSRRGRPFTRLDIDFTSFVANHATLALRNARLAHDLVSAERHATTGRIALALVHDVGKELDWIRSLARRLPGRLGDEKRTRRDLNTIQELSEGLAQDLRSFLRQACATSRDDSGSITFDALVESTLKAMSRLHGSGRVSAVIAPELRQLAVHENLERVVSNLLDNALRASPVDLPVQLSATLEGGQLYISVTDQGSGMDRHILENAFRSGFTTRPEGEGSGVGLSVSRDIVEALGGTIEFDSSPGSGCRVRISLPAPPA